MHLCVAEVGWGYGICRLFAWLLFSLLELCFVYSYCVAGCFESVVVLFSWCYVWIMLVLVRVVYVLLVWVDDRIVCFSCFVCCVLFVFVCYLFVTLVFGLSVSCCCWMVI